MERHSVTKDLLVLFSLSACLTLLVAGAALAHVEVSPGEVRAGSSETFTVSVPTELDVPTTEVRVEVPEGFEVTGVEEVAGWQVEEEEEGGRVTAITWTGGEIPADGSEEFVFEATVPEEAGEFPFRAIQTYEDGTVVEWTGAEDSNEPASVVRVGEGPDDEAGSHGHGHSHGSGAAPLPDSGGAGYALLGGGLALMLLGAALPGRRP